MSRPLVADAKRKSEAAQFHSRVFSRHGYHCYFCGSPATDAMHIVGRSMLGKFRYAFPEENGRPGCRRCHIKQTDGKLQFKSKDRRCAVHALNKILKVKLETALKTLALVALWSLVASVVLVLTGCADPFSIPPQCGVDESPYADHCPFVPGQPASRVVDHSRTIIFDSAHDPQRTVILRRAYATTDRVCEYLVANIEFVRHEPWRSIYEVTPTHAGKCFVKFSSLNGKDTVQLNVVVH